MPVQAPAVEQTPEPAPSPEEDGFHDKHETAMDYSAHINAREMTEPERKNPEDSAPQSVLEMESAEQSGHSHGQEDVAAADVLKLRSAAENGDGYSQGMLAELYHKGSGVERDLHKAFYWFRQGAEQNDSTSILYLARYYKGEFPQLGISKDLDKAEELLERLAVEGDGFAMTLLGAVLYEKVRSGEKDRLADAAWWYNRGTGGNTDPAHTPESVLKAEREKNALAQDEQNSEKGVQP